MLVKLILEAYPPPNASANENTMGKQTQAT